jgi:hypothetical protein
MIYGTRPSRVGTFRSPPALHAISRGSSAGPLTSMSAGATNMPSPVAFSTASLRTHYVSAADDRCSLGSRLTARRQRVTVTGTERR